MCLKTLGKYDTRNAEVQIVLHIAGNRINKTILQYSETS